MGSSSLLLSVVVIARDEERYIAAALQSAAAVADELLVVLDPRTVDATQRLAEQHGARVVLAPFASFPAQRNRALGLAQGAWVLFLDADERLTPELQQEIQHLKNTQLPKDTGPHGYWIPRYNLYWGRALRGGGWYPDRQLRLLRREHARYDTERLVHELVQLDGPTETLRSHFRHINIETWAELRAKQYAYALAEAATLHRSGVRCKPHNLILQPLREVKRRWWTWHGYRDGLLGILLALTMGWYELIKYWALWRTHKKDTA